MKKQFTDMHKTGNFILESNSDDAFIDTLVSQGDTIGMTAVNKRDITMLVQVNFNQNIDLMSYEKNLVAGNVKAVNVTLGPYEVQFNYLRISGNTEYPQPINAKNGIRFNDMTYHILVNANKSVNETFN